MSADWLTQLLSQPSRALWALILLQIFCWTLAPALSHSAPPLDVVEMYAWGREWVVATFKHPNLPGLVLEPTRILTGQTGWPAYLVSQLFIAVTLWAVFALGRELMDAPRALAGALLLTGIYFFGWVTPEFNHNVAQMPLWALVMLMLWRAVERDHWRDWLLLGVFAGLGLWAKYSSAILLAVAGVWMLWDARARSRLLGIGPWLTILSGAAVVAPQALWLVQNDFAPFAYAARRAEGAWYAPIEFLLVLALDHLPMLIVLVAAGMFGKRIADAPAPPEQRGLRYLLLMGLGPALLTAAAALLSGAGLRSSWGAPMVVLSGLIAVALLSAKFGAARLKRIAIGAVVLVVGVSSLYFAHMAYGARLTGHPLRGNWPQAALSRALERAWASETNDAPLRVVASDIWTAGLVAMDDRDPPSVLINGDISISPWVSEDEIARCGALVVWPADDEPAEALQTLVQGRHGGTVTLPFSRAPNAPPLTMRYVIVAPQADC
jgi:4-amino-4-deoxy-L-arabinose transferase-like glycosyltransferase